MDFPELYFKKMGKTYLNYLMQIPVHLVQPTSHTATGEAAATAVGGGGL